VHTFFNELVTMYADRMSLVLLLDPLLQALPMEALNICNLFDGRISRDFSLHVFHHRLTSVTVTSIPPGNMKYLIDPLQEDQGSEVENFHREPMAAVMSDVLTQAVTTGANWSTIRQANGLVSLQDWLNQLDLESKTVQSLTAGVGAFLYTLGRFGSLLLPSDISVMNLEKVNFLILFDGGNNDASYRRQNSMDVTKSRFDIDRENPLNMIALLSLSGVNSIVGNMWSTPFCSHNRFLHLFFTLLSRKLEVIKCFAETNHHRAMKNTVTLPEYCFVPPSAQPGVTPVGRRSVVSTPKASPSPMNSSRRATAPAKISSSHDSPIKMYIRYARVLWGLPHIQYEA